MLKGAIFYVILVTFPVNIFHIFHGFFYRLIMFDTSLKKLKIKRMEKMFSVKSYKEPKYLTESEAYCHRH